MSDTAASLPHTDTSTDSPTLTPKQEAFARHYAASGNGAAAARAAGYAPDGAKQSAHELLRHPAVAARIALLEDAQGRTLRGEVAVMLDRLDAAIDMALQAGDYRAMLDIARLQAQVAALTGAEAAQRRALLYDRAGGPGPLVRSRHFLDPHAAIAPEARADAPTLAEDAEEAADHQTAQRGAELAELAAAVAELEAELGIDLERAAPESVGPEGADPDFSLPLAGALQGAQPGRPSPSAREALLASAAALRVPEGRVPETARRAA